MISTVALFSSLGKLSFIFKVPQLLCSQNISWETNK